MATLQPTPPAATGTQRGFWTRGPGVALIAAGAVVLGGILLTVGLLLFPPATRGGIKVEVVACGSVGLAAAVDLEVTNTGDQTMTATIGIEYRDQAGTRVDTDELVVGAIEPGGKVRKSETTLLDASADKLQCAVTVKRID